MGEQFDLFAEPPKEAGREEPPPARRILYFDLETQKSADEVGGWSNSPQMGLAVGVVWDSVDRDFQVYCGKHLNKIKNWEDDPAQDLVRKLGTADLVVGFNVKGFDYAVLQPYASRLGVDLQEIPTHDMLQDVHRKLNHRLPLDNLAKCTLGTAKSADGLQSLQWFKEDKLDLIIEYCKQDVTVTRDLFLFGEKNGFVEYDSRSRGRQKLAVDWHSEALIQGLKKGGSPARLSP